MIGGRPPAGSLAATLALSLLCLPMAYAAGVYEKKISVSTTAGERTLIGDWGIHDTKCQTLNPPSLSLVIPPDHGWVCKQATTTVITVNQHPAEINNGRCIGKPIQLDRVFYVPIAGFTGTDTLEYRGEYEFEGEHKNKSARVTMKAVVTVKRSPWPAASGSAAASAPIFEQQRPGAIPNCTALVS